MGPILCPHFLTQRTLQYTAQLFGTSYQGLSHKQAFAVESIISSNDSVVATQHYVPNNVKFLLVHQIKIGGLLLWVKQFRDIGFVLKKHLERRCSAHKPEHISAVRHSMLQSPECSARKRSGFLDSWVCWILRLDLYFHLHQIVVVQNPDFVIDRVMW